MADLKGKSVAVSSPGSFPEIFARAAFEKAGIPAGQVRFAAMGSDTERFKALMAGIVDGAIISNEYVPIAGQDGIRDLMPAAEVMPDFIRVCIEMTGKTVRERRPEAVRFIAAEIDALRFAMSHRDETIRIASEITGAKPDDPRPGFVFDAAVRTKAVATDLPLPLEKLEFMQKQLINSGVLVRPTDLEKMIDRSLREEALAVLATSP
jgi:NitT/TauT family transport system substrate-binding protein